MKWFIPSCNGDFRLEPAGANTVLITVKPTAHERELLNVFLRLARKQRWTDVQEASAADQVIALTGPMAKVAPLLVKCTKPKRTTITAVSFKDGHVEVAEGSDSAALAQLAERAVPSTSAAPAQRDPPTILMEKEPPRAAASAAASVARPTMCCPECIPGAVEPATEVLLSFLTPEQHEDWAKHRAIVVTGGRSGHRYVLAHRNTPRAQRQTKICMDLDDKQILHFHDWTVPPEEEVLAAKLILENREEWLRNEASMFGWHGLRYKNPFGDHLDGTQDAAVTSGIGVFFASMGYGPDR